jgi:hypothetical protein
MGEGQTKKVLVAVGNGWISEIGCQARHYSSGPGLLRRRNP